MNMYIVWGFYDPNQLNYNQFFESRENTKKSLVLKGLNLKMSIYLIESKEEVVHQIKEVGLNLALF